MDNQCVQCGKNFGGDWPSCHQIENDYPNFMGIENPNWKKQIENLFQEAQKLRCEFLDFLIQRKFAKPDPDNDGRYILPEDIELFPAAMIELEQEIVEQAINTVYTDETNMAFEKDFKGYSERVKRFFENQYQWLTNIEPETV